MKKLILAIAIAAIFITSSIVYAGQFGPPEPAAKEGKVSLGVGYFYSSAKWKPKDTDWKESKVTQNQTYLQVGYGFVKNAEVYLRAGGADAKFTNTFLTSADEPTYLSGFKSDFKDGYKPFGTIGVKGVFNVSDSFGIGPFLQASLYSSYKDSTSGTAGGSASSQTITVKNPREINLGVGLQGKIGDVIIYGGPVAYWTKAKVAWTASPSASWEVSSVSTTYKEKNNIGGFAGVRIPLSKSLNLEVEGQYKSEFSMGGALTYAF